MKEHFYILSMAAVITRARDPASPRSGLNLITHVGLHLRTAFAPTLEDAKRIGEELALQLLPESEGWTGHHTNVNMLDRETLARALRAADDDENGDEDERAELIM